MKKQKENSHEGITWSEMGKENVQAEKVYSPIWPVLTSDIEKPMERLQSTQLPVGGTVAQNELKRYNSESHHSRRKVSTPLSGGPALIKTLDRSIEKLGLES